MTPRSQLIERSLSCLYWGVAALIPVVGFVAGPVALERFAGVVTRTNDRWNPARTQLYFGMALAVLGLLAHALAAFLIYLQVIRSYQNG